MRFNELGMGQKPSNPKDKGFGGALRNSLSKLTGRVNVKATPGEPLPAVVVAEPARPLTQPATPPRPITPPEKTASPLPIASQEARSATVAPIAAPNTPSATSATSSQPASAPVPAAQKPTKPTTLGNPAPNPASPISHPTPAGEVGKINRIANDVSVDGKIRFLGQLFVNGRVKGEIVSEGQLVVEREAILDATIQAASVIVEGTITGNITASKEVRLTPSAKVIGDITTAILTIDSGSVFSGQAHVGKASVAS